MRYERTWRDDIRPQVAAVLRATAGQDEKAIRKALRAAWPYGQRNGWPYKVWLDEIHMQRGVGMKKPPQRAPRVPDTQLSLFRGVA